MLYTAIFDGCKNDNFQMKRGGSTLYEINIGFCPHIDFRNFMHIDCLTYDYSICGIVFLLPIYMVKNEMLCNRVSDYRGTFSLSSP